MHRFYLSTSLIFFCEKAENTLAAMEYLNYKGSKATNNLKNEGRI